MKWFVTDEISRIHGYGTTGNVLDEVEPNTVFSFGGGNPFQTRGWRIRVQDLDAPRGEKTKRVFTTLKAAKAYVEKTHREDANMADENRPTSDEFECESCGECIFENEAVECENCSRGCCTLCSPESICPDCQE